MEVKEIAFKETDPRYYDSFQPVTYGFILNFLLVSLIVIFFSPYIIYKLLISNFIKKFKDG